MLRLSLQADGDHLLLIPESRTATEAVSIPADAEAASVPHLLVAYGLSLEESGDDLAVFAEEGDTPLEGPLSLGDGLPTALILAPRRLIEVTVHYEGRFVGQHVPAPVRLARVRREAVAALGLENPDAYVLHHVDTDLQPDEHTRIGALDRNADGELALDLVRTVPVTVTIKVNNKAAEIAPGRRSVAEVKRAGGVPQADVLEQVVQGCLVELADDAHVEIEGGECFVSHPRDSASS